MSINVAIVIFHLRLTETNKRHIQALQEPVTASLHLHVFGKHLLGFRYFITVKNKNRYQCHLLRKSWQPFKSNRLVLDKTHT